MSEGLLVYSVGLIVGMVPRAQRIRAVLNSVGAGEREGEMTSLPRPELFKNWGSKYTTNWNK